MNATFRSLIHAALATTLLSVTAPAVSAAGTPGASVSAAVTTVAARQQDFSESITGYGSLQSDPRHALSLSLPQAVRIAAVHATTGERVHAGQVLLTLQADPAARLAYLQARQQLQLAQSALKQTRNLYAQRLATQSQLDTAEKTLADARANLATQRALGGGSDNSVLRAPADGVVEALAVRAGEHVAAGTTLLRLAPAQSLQACIGVEPGDAARLRPAMKVTLTPAFGGAVIDGRVAQVADAVDPQTRLVPVWVALPAGGSRLPLGSELEAQIHSGTLRAWAVPRDAVLTDGHGAYLFQIDHGVAHRIAVKLVQPDGDTVGVSGPLNAQWPVVALGAYELEDGMRVQATPQ